MFLRTAVRFRASFLKIFLLRGAGPEDSQLNAEFLEPNIDPLFLRTVTHVAAPKMTLSTSQIFPEDSHSWSRSWGQLFFFSKPFSLRTVTKINASEITLEEIINFPEDSHRIAASWEQSTISLISPRKIFSSPISPVSISSFRSNIN